MFVVYLQECLAPMTVCRGSPPQLHESKSTLPCTTALLCLPACSPSKCSLEHEDADAGACVAQVWCPQPR